MLAKANGIRSNPMAIPFQHVLPIKDAIKIKYLQLCCHGDPVIKDLVAFNCCLLWSKFVGLLKIICPVFFWFWHLMVGMVVFMIQSNLDYPYLDYPDFFSGPNLVMNIY